MNKTYKRCSLCGRVVWSKHALRHKAMHQKRDEWGCVMQDCTVGGVIIDDTVKCPACNGWGAYDEGYGDDCRTCDGDGVVFERSIVVGSVSPVTCTVTFR